MIRTWKERGLVLLTAAPLLGAVPMGAVAQADGLAPAAHKSRQDSAPKPPPRPRTHAKPTKPRKPKAEGVVLRTSAPKKDVMPGRTYAWTFTVTAKGPARSGRAVFRTTLPKSLAFVSGERRCTARGRTVVCRLGTVRKGRLVKGVIRAKVSKAARPGRRIRPRGTVTWAGTRVTRRFPAVRVARTADLVLTEKAPAKARAGARIPYTVKVRNLGPATAENVIVESTGPIRIVGRDTACLRRGSAYRCAVGRLRAGESRTLHFTAVPRKKVRAGTVLTSSWRATSPTADADAANNTAVGRTRITRSRRPVA